MKNALLFLNDVVFALIIYPHLLRFWMQVLRAPFRNPLGDAVLALTNWTVRPLRRVIPGLFGLDLASLLVTFVACWVRSALAVLIVAGAIDLAIAGWLGLHALVAILKTSIQLLMVVIIVQALMSWFAPDGPMAGVLNALTFRFLRPVRRLVPPIGGKLDLSPLIVIVICQLILMLPVLWLEQQLRIV